jgi:hypothetical protein
MGHWLMDTPGVGSIIVLGVGACVLAAYIAMLRWIKGAPPESVPIEASAQDEDGTATERGGEEA